MGLRLCGCPGFALTEDTGDILVVGLQAGFDDNKPLVNITHAGFQGSHPVGQPAFHFADPAGQAGMTPGIGTYDGYDQRYQVYGLFVHLCCLSWNPL